MSKQIHNPFLEESSHQRTAKLRRNIAAYVRRWPVFVLSILIFLFLAWLYTRYLTPIYQSNIKILVKDAKQNPGTNMLFSDIALTGNLNGGIDNEMQILRSMRLMTKVVDNLGLENIYTKEGRIIETEAFGLHLPIILQSYPADSLNPVYQRFSVNYQHPDIQVTTVEGNVFETKVNQPFLVNQNTFVFVKNPKGYQSESDNFNVVVTNPNSVARNLQSRLNIEIVGSYSTVLNLSMNMANSAKAEAILNHLVEVYNEDAIIEKNYEFEKTEEFIEERIVEINKELGGVEEGKVDFKEQHSLADLGSESAQSIGMKPGLEGQLMATETQLSLVNSYKNYVQNKGITEILPSDVSDGSGGVNEVVRSYNTLVTERNNFLATGATENHPEVQNLTANINGLKGAIMMNIERKASALQSVRNDIAGQLGAATSLKSSVPRLEKITREIERQQQIKESLYLLLLQKREEAAISKAITSEKAKIIDPPYSVGPVAPVKSYYYYAAFALGLLLPLATIYTKELLKNKIETRGDLEELVNGEPIVAELPRINEKDEFNLVGNDLSIMSEAFRIMRTNIEFVMSQRLGNLQRGKVILVTSSIKGEGKTFIAMNYAHVLGQLKGTKSIIIGADIRNPQLHRYDRSSKKALGLTEYLYDETIELSDVINVSKSDGKTHIIFSGRIPPNPTELLMSKRFDEMVEELRQTYDYVVIDSAPLVLVSDTFHISKNADLTVYITRSEFTPKDVIRVPMDALEEGRLKNVVFSLNDISTTHSGYAYGYKYNYGYGYGYGTGNKKANLWSKIISTFNFSKNG